jgi:hypothetical protein
MSIPELLLERDKITGDFIQSMAEWLDEFNRVTDEMLEAHGGNLMDMDGVDDRRDDSGKYEAVEHA